MHTLVIGMTESGKSCISKLLASSLHNKGCKVAVLDPLNDPDWKADFVSDDIEAFRAYLESNRKVFAFVDECGQWFNEGNDTTHSWLATRSRHYGHSVTFIAQRAIQVPKTMRDQCGRLYLFTSSQSDGKIHAEEWNKPELMDCNKLPQLHFFVVDRYNTTKKMRIVGYTNVESVGSNGGGGESGRRGNHSDKRRQVGRKDGREDK